MQTSDISSVPNNSNNSSNQDIHYESLGHVVRALHDALNWVGAGNILAEAANEFPNARERLNHVGKLTENAANTVISTVEAQLPGQHAIASDADHLLAKWDSSTLNALQPEQLNALAELTRAFIQNSKNRSIETQSALTSIMMAQDFQDLTGQLIIKIVDLLERTERDLLSILISGAPAGTISDQKKEDFLAGPGSVGGVQLDQSNVDDLLADLGF
jgi:chemotaxis protein CheZ